MPTSARTTLPNGFVHGREKRCALAIIELSDCRAWEKPDATLSGQFGWQVYALRQIRHHTTDVNFWITKTKTLGGLCEGRRGDINAQIQTRALSASKRIGSA
jgi:hypothetical protein